MQRKYEISDSWFKHVQVYVVGSTSFGPGDLVKKMSVTLDRPASVYVHYETQGARKLKSQTIDTDESNNSEIILARLRPGSEYKYTVFAEGSEEVSKPYKGDFTVNPLPPDIEEGMTINRLISDMSELTIVAGTHAAFKGLMVLEHENIVVWYRRSYIYDPVIGSVNDLYRDSEFNFIRLIGDSNIHTYNHLIVTDVFGKENEQRPDYAKNIVIKKADECVFQQGRVLTAPTDSIYGETVLQNDQD